MRVPAHVTVRRRGIRIDQRTTFPLPLSEAAIACDEIASLVHVTDPAVRESAALQPSGRVNDNISYHRPIRRAFIVVETTRKVRACARGIRSDRSGVVNVISDHG